MDILRLKMDFIGGCHGKPNGSNPFGDALFGNVRSTRTIRLHTGRHVARENKCRTQALILLAG
jgi:hypothetical protein